MTKYINDCVMWEKKTKNGKTYFSWKAERDIKTGESINIFINNKNGVETRPDYRAYTIVTDDAEPENKTVEGDGRPF